MHRTLFTCLLAVFLSGVILAQDPPDAPQPEPTGPRVSERLLDCRSPVMTHEVVGKPGEPIDVAGVVITVSKEGRSKVAWRCEGAGEPTNGVSEELPFLITFPMFDSTYGISVRIQELDDVETVHLSSAWGQPFDVGDSEAWIVDSNLDGQLGNKGDGFVAPQSGTVGPFDGAGELWSESAAIKVTRQDTGEFSVEPVTMPKADDADHSMAWRFVQWRRQQCGILPLAYDESLEAAMIKHADYLVDNKERGHSEDPSKKGYSPEGHQAGMQSVIGFQKASYDVGIFEQLDTLYHRNSCLRPASDKSAMVLHRGIFMMNTGASLESSQKWQPLVFPAHGMIEVDISFNRGGEEPMPAPGGYKNKLGTPISVSGFHLVVARTLAEDPVITLYELGKSRPKKGPKGHFYWPGNATKSLRESDPNNRGCVGYTPKKYLDTATTHRVVARIKLDPGAKRYDSSIQTDFIYVWEFETEDED